MTYLPAKELTIEVQEKLFEIGFRWIVSGAGETIIHMKIDALRWEAVEICILTETDTMRYQWDTQ